MVEISAIADAGKHTAEFLVYGVGVSYLGKRYIGNMVIKEGRKLITKSERNSAIWQHYQKQAKGEGHESASVFGCGEGKCQVFGSVAQIA